MREYTHHGRAARATDMADALRYVVLHHTGYGEPHYDLMFETAAGSPLATWRSATWPTISNLTALADHRSAYLDYEGPVSNNRGQVRRAVAGTHTILEHTPQRLHIQLDTGERLDLPKQT